MHLVTFGAQESSFETADGGRPTMRVGLVHGQLIEAVDQVLGQPSAFRSWQLQRFAFDQQCVHAPILVRTRSGGQFRTRASHLM